MKIKHREQEPDMEQVNYSSKTSWIAFVILFAVAFVMLVPLLWIFISSFKVATEVIQAGGFLYLFDEHSCYFRLR